VRWTKGPRSDVASPVLTASHPRGSCLPPRFGGKNLAHCWPLPEQSPHRRGVSRDSSDSRYRRLTFVFRHIAVTRTRAITGRTAGNAADRATRSTVGVRLPGCFQSSSRRSHGPEPMRSEADDAALYEFAEEEEAPRSPWRRGKFTSALGWFAAEQPKVETPVASANHQPQILPRMGWIAIAAGLIACVAITAAIVLRPAAPAPTRSSNNLPARSVPFVPTALPRGLSQVRPIAPLRTFDRDVTVWRTIAVTAAPLPAPAPASVVESRPLDTRPALPALPSAPAPVAPVASAPAPEPVAPSIRAEAVARAPEPAAATPTPIERDEHEIRSLLDAYRDSYDRRDAVSTARVWPGVDTAALSRAFGTLASQQLEFEQCALDVIGQRATVRCSGSLQYVRRIGAATPQSRTLSWDFELDRSTGRWLISRVTAQ
jgi:hypothetical protein